jgi:hypothetical protein
MDCIAAADIALLVVCLLLTIACSPALPFAKTCDAKDRATPERAAGAELSFSIPIEAERR